MTYFANMSVNNGTRYGSDLVGTNKKQLARAISKSARANCFVGNKFILANLFNNKN